MSNKPVTLFGFPATYSKDVPPMGEFRLGRAWSLHRMTQEQMDDAGPFDEDGLNMAARWVRDNTPPLNGRAD